MVVVHQRMTTTELRVLCISRAASKAAVQADPHAIGGVADVTPPCGDVADALRERVIFGAEPRSHRRSGEMSASRHGDAAASVPHGKERPSRMPFVVSRSASEILQEYIALRRHVRRSYQRQSCWRWPNSFPRAQVGGRGGRQVPRNPGLFLSESEGAGPLAFGWLPVHCGAREPHL